MASVTNTEDGWKTLTMANDWVKVADTKAGVVITAGGVLAGLVVNALGPPGRWAASPWRTGLQVSALALVCVAVVLALRVFAPRLRPSARPSLLYFDHIAACHATPDEFAASLRRVLDDPDRLATALAEQTWAVSMVARRKFRHLTPALWTLVAGLLVSVVAGVLPA